MFVYSWSYRFKQHILFILFILISIIPIFFFLHFSVNAKKKTSKSESDTIHIISPTE